MATYNPGALMKSAVNYAGKIPHSINKSGRLEKFVALEWGTRAAILNVITKIRSAKTNTLRKLMYVYAPPEENDTEAYIAALAKRLGISPDAKLSEAKSTIQELVIAISEKEGLYPLTVKEFEAGLAIINKTINVKAVKVS